MLTTRNRSREGLSRADAIVVLIVGVMMSGVSISCVRRVHDGGGRTQTQNTLKQLSLACHSVNDTYKKLPPAFDKFGELDFPASVHVHLLPYVEQDNLYKLFRAEKGSEQATDALVPPFIAPHDPSSIGDLKGIQNFAANLRAFSKKGLKTDFDADMPALADVEPGAASIPKSFPDGTSNTLSFATKLGTCVLGGSRYAAGPTSDFAAFFGQNAARTKAAPADPTATYQRNPTLAQCLTAPLMAQSFSDVGLSVGLFDGSVRMVSPSLSPRTWNQVVQPNDKLALGKDWDG